MDHLESWIAFRDGERVGFLTRREACCLCGNEAQGNAQFTDGDEICDSCVENDLAAP